MAMNTLKNPYNIPIGSWIKGKWHNNRYRIQRELGRGANGVVYLAEWNGRKVAVKMSETHYTVTSETNVLKALSKAQGVTLGPSLLDVDDWESGNGKYAFYVMEYIEGEQFLSFIKRKGTIWLDILILQLLSDLEIFHRNGWVFGDLKPDNLIVTQLPVKLRCIDVGGTTKIGRAIKEFTEFFDRGYWELGSRRAEPSYDLFAVAMVMMNVFYPNRFPKKRGGIEQLKQMIVQREGLKRYEPVILRALTGQYKQATEMRKDMLALVALKGMKTHSFRSTKKNIAGNQRKTKRRKITGAIETLFILLIIGFLYGLYIYARLG